MEKILISKNLGEALLSFRSNDKYLKALNGIYSAENGDIVSTDGKRLLVVGKEKHSVTLAPGNYAVTAKGKAAKGLIWIMVEKVEDSFPDYTQVMPKVHIPLKEGEKELSFAFVELKGRIDHLRMMSVLFKVHHITGKKFDPLLVLDLPQDEGFMVSTSTTESGVLHCKGEGIQAIFCPFKGEYNS